MVETGGKLNSSWYTLQPALEPLKKSGLLPSSTNSDCSVSVSGVNKACFADLVSC